MHRHAPALLSGGLPALTAIFAKVVVRDTNSDYATPIRTIVILGIVSPIGAAKGYWQVSRRSAYGLICPVHVVLRRRHTLAVLFKRKQAGPCDRGAAKTVLVARFG